MREETKYNKVLKQLLKWANSQLHIDTQDFTITIDSTKNGNFRYTLNKEFSLPYSNKKFSLLFVNKLKNKVTSVLLLDNHNMCAYWFCSIYKVCGMNSSSFSSFLKRKFNKQWKVVEIIPKNVNLPRDSGELPLQNLIWQFLFIDLKVNNDHLSNDLLIEYLLNNSNKRQFSKIFKEFYKNVKTVTTYR